MTFPILRVFTAIKRIRLLLFTLISLVPSVGSVLAMLVVVFLFYGQLGVFLFNGQRVVLQVHIARVYHHRIARGWIAYATSTRCITSTG